MGGDVACRAALLQVVDYRRSHVVPFVVVEVAMNEVVLAGRGLLESTRWHGGQLYVSDWSAGEVLVLGEGGAEVVARVDSLPLCFDFLPDGAMVVLDSAGGRLLRLGRQGRLDTLVELGDGTWNDITVDGYGRVFLDQVDLEGGDGSLHLVVGSTVQEVARGLAFPNGMAVLGATLVVAESHGQRLTAFDIGGDGGLQHRRVWAPLADGAAPDGICPGPDGTIWYADVPGRHCVRVREGGHVLGTVTVDRGAFDCVLDGTTLYVATAEFLGMAELVAPGSGQVVAADVS
jgi:sugar lactone lactonase YvrE